MLGNGDIWEADDALRMVRETGCDGVVVGRGCLGRPWLFRDLVARLRRASRARQPDLGEVAAMMRRHAQLLGEWLGEEHGRASTSASTSPGTSRASRSARELRRAARPGLVAGRARRTCSASSTWTSRCPGGADGPRGRTAGSNRVALPDGWLDDPDDCAGVSADAELDTSGG